MPLVDLNRGINVRDHNPEYNRLHGGLVDQIDSLLGFEEPPVFEPDDDIYSAILKASRNHIVADNWRKTVIVAIGRQQYPRIKSSLNRLFEETFERLTTRFRFARIMANGGDVFRYGLLLLYFLTRRIRHEYGRLRRGIPDWLHHWVDQHQFWNQFSEHKPDFGARPVCIVTPLSVPHIGYALGKIISKFRAENISVVCIFVDGFNPRTSSSIRAGWEWLESVESISLPAIPGALYETLVGLFVSQLPRKYHSNKFPGLSRTPGLKANFQKYAREFVFAANCVSSLLKAVAPRSILNMADSRVYGQAFSYCCVLGETPVYSYVPMIRYPTRFDAPLTPSHLVSSRLDIPDDHGRHSQRTYTVVGSPLLDASARVQFDDVPRKQGVLHLAYFTKRDYPNQSVLAQIKQVMDQLSERFHLVIKPHPTDFFDYSCLTSLLGKSEYTIVKADRIEAVEDIISSSDVVITGPSNVLWSAFYRHKPVVFVNSVEAGASHYPQAYRRYAPAPFVPVLQISEFGDALSYLFGRMDEEAETPIDDEKDQALLRDVFNSGGEDPAQQVAALLTRAGTAP